MFSFPDIVFRHPVAIIYHLFHIHFRLKYNLLVNLPYYMIGLSSTLLKLLHCMSKFRIACERDIS
jgi:hypothetical protein